MTLARHSYLILYAIFALSCARQTAPTGGPKDSIPPTLISSQPQSNELNFKGKTIQLAFSEHILLNNPRDQIIITPDLGKPVNATARKNQVTITLEDELKPNTTYSINFREAIQDITEKNPAAMLKLAFSTGSYIDSLEIDGNAFDPLSAKEIKDATLALYENDTFNIFKHRATYVTKSDTKGFFKIENLKPGKYFLYGFEDKNKNLIVDSKTESYGFLRAPLQLEENITALKVPLVRLDSRPLKLTSSRPSGTYFNIKASKSLSHYQITTTEEETIISSFGEDLANIRVYNTFEDKDSVSIHLTAIDSISNAIDTTLYVKFLKRQVTPEAFEFKLDKFEVIGTKGILRGQIQFNKPVLAVNFDSIFYRIDSLQVIPINAQNIRWDSLRNILFLEKIFDKNLLPKETASTSTSEQRRSIAASPIRTGSKTSNKNQFYIGNAAFVSIELDSSKRAVNNYTPTKLEDTGIILVEVQTQAPHFFVQLLSKDFQILRSMANLRKFNFEDLKPGDYQLRLVIDENNDAKWDPGNFYLKRQPEEILFYKNEKGSASINLKANWELGPLLIKH
jgi:uncharacterized protein (DUF2141 family)